MSIIGRDFDATRTNTASHRFLFVGYDKMILCYHALPSGYLANFYPRFRHQLSQLLEIGYHDPREMRELPPPLSH